MTKYIFTKNEVVDFGAFEFNKRLFTQYLQNNGVRSQINEPVYDDGVIKLWQVTGEPELQDWQSKSNPVYTLTSTEAQVSYTITDTPIETYKQQRIAQVYNKAASLLDAQAQGYSQPEIATWPLIQADIIAYNADNNVVGTAMQAVIDQGIHTAASLSSLLTPRITYQQSVLANRAALVNAINIAADHATVAAVDITAGW